MRDSKTDILAIKYINESNAILYINESKLIDNRINDHEVYTPVGRVCFYLRSNLNFKVCEEHMIDRLECFNC